MLESSQSTIELEYIAHVDEPTSEDKERGIMPYTWCGFSFSMSKLFLPTFDTMSEFIAKPER